MALAVYTDIVSAVSDYLARSGDSALSNRIPDFIVLAEQRIYYGGEPPYATEPLRVKAMEQRATASIDTASASPDYLALPSDYLEMRNLQLNTNPMTTLTYVTPQELDWLSPGPTTAKPSRYSILGNTIQFSPSPDSNYTVEMEYYKTLGALTAPAPSNDLLTTWPGLYLNGTLFEAALYKRDDANMARYFAAFASGLNGAQRTEKRGRFGGSALTMRPERYA